MAGLGTILKAVGSHLNPFDGGANYSSVMEEERRRKEQQAQLQRQQAQQQRARQMPVGVLTPQGQQQWMAGSPTRTTTPAARPAPAQNPINANAELSQNILQRQQAPMQQFNATKQIVDKAEERKQTLMAENEALRQKVVAAAQRNRNGRSDQQIQKEADAIVRGRIELQQAQAQEQRDQNKARTAKQVRNVLGAPVDLVRGAVMGAGSAPASVGSALSQGLANTIDFLGGDANDEYWARFRENARRADATRQGMYDSSVFGKKEDDSMVHDLGAGAGRLVLDAGVAAAVPGGSLIVGGAHGAEVHADTMNDALDKGQSISDAYKIAAANAATQAVIERVGIEKLIGPGGKSVISNAIRGAMAEGLQEGTQQFADNAYKRIYDQDKKLLEGVPESVLMGALLGGPVGGINIRGQQGKIEGSGGVNDTKTVIETALNSPQAQVDLETVRNIAQNSPSLTERVAANRVLSERFMLAGQNATGYADAQAQGLVFDGVDGKPRFEVDDSGAKLNIDRIKSIKLDDNIKGFPKVKLAEILDHPRLFDQYPELRNTDVQLDTLTGGTAGSYNPTTNELTIDSVRSKLDPEATKSTILHEIQHSIQEREGFARGGDLSTVSGLDDVTIKQANEVRSLIEQVRGDVDPIGKINRSNATESTKAWATNLIRSGDKGIKEFYSDLPIEQYRRLAGEAEARAVQARMDMPMSERYVTKDGEYFHGTNAKFDEFDPTKVNTVESSGDYAGAGFYFTKDKAKAQRYAKQAVGRNGGEENIISADLELKNPLIIKSDADVQKFFDSFGGEEKYFEIEAESPLSIQRELQRRGYDGVIDRLYDQTTVFDKNQIKVAKPRSTFYDSLDVPKEDLIVRNDQKLRTLDQPSQNKTTEKAVTDRSQMMFGDKNVSFHDLGTYNGVRIDGYYADDMISLSKGNINMDTFNHESVHRAFDQFLGETQRQQILDQIIKDHGGAKLVQKYRKMGYGDINVKVAAEEELANGFIKYANAKAEGKKIAGINIPPKFLAYFDRVWQGIKSFVGKADNVTQLYAQLETGKFRNAQVKPRTMPAQLAENIANHPEMAQLDETLELRKQQIEQLKERGRAENYSQIVQLNKSIDEIINQQTQLARQLQGSMMLDPEMADHYIRETASQHSSPDQYRQSLIDDIWARNKQGKGVDTGLIENNPGEGSGYSGRWAMSNNSPFYQEFYAEYGHKPTKKAITEMVDAELRGEETMLSRGSEVSPYEADIYEQIKEAHEGRRVAMASEATAKSTAQDAQEKLQPAPQQTKSKESSPQSTQANQPEESPKKSQSSNPPAAHTRNASPVREPGSQRKLDDGTYSTKNITDADISQYVDKQVKKQQAEVRVGMKDRIVNFFDNSRHALIDDAVAHERYIKDKTKRAQIREGVDRVRGSDMIARHFAEENGLKELGKMKTADLNEFQQYLIAKRAQELEARGIKTGRNSAVDKAMVKKLSKKYEAQEKIVRDYSRAMLDYSVEGGLISKELRDSLLKENPNYVPMNRVMDSVEQQNAHKSKQLGSLSKQSVVKKIEGSERTVDNPIESLLRNTLRMANEVERNKVATMLATDNAFKENVVKDGDKIPTGYDTIAYLDGGEKVRVAVPKLVATEMRNLNGVLPDWAETTLRIVGAPTKMLRTGATGANPIFTVTNVIRDQLQTTITGSLKANLKGTPKAFVAAFSPGKKGAELRRELQKNGIVGSEYRQTYGYKSGQLMKELQRSNNLSKQAVDRLRHPIDSIADLIGRTEYFTRAQQYYGTSGTAMQKAQAARNNSLNFSRAGAVTRVANRVIPFLNAAVQGGRITVNQFHQRPVRTSVAFATFAGLAMAARALNEGDDEERKALWDRIGDEEKKTNLIIFSDDARYDKETNRVVGVTKIPMPQMLYPVMDAVNNTKGEPEDFAKIAGDIFTATTGLEAPIEDGKLSVKPAMNQLTPTFAKPAVEASLNKSLYTGNDLVSEYDKNQAPEDQGKKYTSGVARDLAKVTGWSAPVIDNFIGSWGGGVAKDLTKALSDNPDNAKDGKGIAGVYQEGFTRRLGSASVTSQYEIQEKLAEEYKKQMNDDANFKKLPREDQVKVLDKIDLDTRAIAGIAAKTEQGKSDEIKRDLSARQKSIVEEGFNPQSYLESATSQSTSGVKISKNLDKTHKTVLEQYNNMDTDQRREWFDKENDAEYKYELARYNNNLAENKLSTAGRIKAQKSLRKSAIGKDYSKNVRDLYSLSKADLADYLTTEEEGVDKQKLYEQLVEYDRKLKEAGLTTSLKFKTGLASGKGGRSGGKGGRGGKGGSRGTGITAMNDYISTVGGVNRSLAGNVTKMSGKGFSESGSSVKPAQLKKTTLTKGAKKKSYNQKDLVKSRRIS